MLNKPSIGSPVMAAFDLLIEAGVKLSPRATWELTLAAICLAGLFDYLTGPWLWMGPFYIVIICIPTWSLGERAGFVTGVMCLVIGLTLNGAAIDPSGSVELLWNLAMRVLAVGIVVMLVAGFRRSYDREWRQARTDRLTGALTKQAFLEQQALHGMPIGWRALAYLDLDNFKAINDRHGHAAGDAMLRLLAANVQEMLGGLDRFVRVGGDEFLLDLWVRDEAEGRAAAISIHHRLNLVLNAQGYKSGCSTGVLLIPPHSTSIGEHEIEAADVLMYKAKRERALGLRIGVHMTVPERAQRELIAA